MVVWFVPGSANHFCHYPVSSIGHKLIPQKNREQPNMSFPVKLFQFLSICNSRSSGELVRQSSRGVESPAKFLLCCASPCFVCPVCGRGVHVKCFLQVSCQIHGRQQSQHPGFAWPLPKAVSRWTSPSSAPLGNCSSSALSVPRVHLNIAEVLQRDI